MKRKPYRVQILPEHETPLAELGAPYNMTGNAVLAAAAAELARLHEGKGNLWHALGRIAADAAPLAAGAPRIGRNAPRALQATG